MDFPNFACVFLYGLHNLQSGYQGRTSQSSSVHPTQDRVLTIRENARLQGFPDFYQLVGGVKDRYIQVGNAVAVPVARALGYSLAMAMSMSSEVPLDGSLCTLPTRFPNIYDDRSASSPSVEDNS